MAKAQKFTVIECNHNADTNFYTLKLITKDVTKGVLGTKTKMTSYWINGLEEEVKVDTEFDITIGKDYVIEEKEHTFTEEDEATGELVSKTATLRWLIAA